MRVLVDTSAWYAMEAERDAHHIEAAACWKDIFPRLKRVLVTPWILSETITQFARMAGSEVHFGGPHGAAQNGVETLSLTCPSCGNAENFLVKTLQMHLLRVADGQFQPPLEEGRPALVELLCDECENTLDLDALDEPSRRELMVTLGAR